MARFRLSAVFLAALGAQLAAPVQAQFGTIFGNDPPRPPGNVPSNPPAPAPPVGPPPGVQQAPTSVPPTARQGSIQSQPLAPPPGSSAAPPPAISLNPAPLPGLPQGQRQPRGTPQPGNAALPPSDDVAPEQLGEKVPNPTGVFAGLDKITGRITSFDVAVGETVQFGALQVTPRACYTRKPTETPNTDAFIEVDEVTLQGEVRRIYTGWMFASSPGLHAVEHPIYDVWLTDCKGGVVADAVVAEPAPAPSAPRAPTRAQAPSQPARPAPQRAPAPQFPPFQR
jgi:hypothetical protein